ncbi:DUF1330 domain-containing protein [Zhongshania aquimaris]|uniref:DUF1330 domain-containing protein n=1 Tax=Zhongshania aquimaris TaxID=2857107 RepID=A0ABS6VWH3_9GAMM|nr:DUF1330 domain-containing protein [Zhongshania aquimaris]MBW2942684.1 DUF1330 domain-containing protein [Zhongshania aquimaris]
MPAYLVVIQKEAIHDPEAFATYHSLTREIASSNLTPKVIYGDVAGLEGLPPEGVVILEFPTMEEAQAWYNSTAYQEALPYRLKASSYQSFIVAGLA